MTDEFAKRVGLSNKVTHKEQSLLFLISRAGADWKAVYQQMYGQPEAQFARNMDRELATLAEEEDDLHQMLQLIKQSHAELEASSLKSETNASSFFSRFPQIAALQKALSQGPRQRTLIANWTPLDFTKAYLVVMSGPDYFPLWTECFKDSLPDSKSILDQYRLVHKQIDVQEYASLLEAYVA